MRQVSLLTKGIAPHNTPTLVMTGDDLQKASAALIMVHGRGATAEGILDLSQYFLFEGVSYIAPQADGGTWYPYSFLVPIEQNEPGLTSALQKLTDVVDFVVESGIPENRVMLLGFSQGASLSLEWSARNARELAAVFALSGGVIGPPGTKREYSGTLNGTTVFLGCSDVDFHIPKERVVESANVLKNMGAEVTLRLYPNLPHTVNDDEIYFINSFIKNLVGK
ncbi:MAG: dienelactone hydrolase family protein [Bacteroidota bacterium]